MREMRFQGLPVTLVLLLCAVAGGVDLDLPDYVKQALQAGSATGSAAQLMVTNEEFKQFKLHMDFDPKEAVDPAPMTEREAADYATFVGKKIGTDLYWYALPPDVAIQQKIADLGYLVNLAPGMNIGLPNVKPAIPAAPPGMVYVPEGPFIMGSDVGDPDESPKHTTTAGPFFIDKYEVGNAEFKQAFPDFTFAPGRENHAAIVTWEQAVAYTQKVGKRLPTEPEWEKAARGTDGRIFPWGNSYDPTFVSWDESYPRGGAPACPESPYGCIDMAGGAWEWTADWYKPYEGNDAPSDEYGEKSRVIRGGASFNDVAMFRTTHRYYLPQNTTGSIRVGFRCVKDL